LIETVRSLGGVEFISLSEWIDTTNPGEKLVFHIFGAIAEFERDLIRQRTNAGLAAARARGRLDGGQRKLSPKQVPLLPATYDAMDTNGQPIHNINELCEMVRISRATLFRYVTSGQRAYTKVDSDAA
jgi:DNA invertase Pin-like site-specific DNA recombinase